MTRATLRTTAYWVTTIFGPTSFLIGGWLGVSRDPQVLATLHHLGYPEYFAAMSGTWKILGALVFELTAAAISRTAVGDGLGDVLAPLVFLALVVASWALRPASRRLPARADHEVITSSQATPGRLALATP